MLNAIQNCYDTETKEFTDGSEWVNYEDVVAAIEELPFVTV